MWLPGKTGLQDHEDRNTLLSQSQLPKSLTTFQHSSRLLQNLPQRDSFTGCSLELPTLWQWARRNETPKIQYVQWDML